MDPNIDADDDTAGRQAAQLALALYLVCSIVLLQILFKCHTWYILTGWLRVRGSGTHVIDVCISLTRRERDSFFLLFFIRRQSESDRLNARQEEWVTSGINEKMNTIEIKKIENVTFWCWNTEANQKSTEKNKIKSKRQQISGAHFKSQIAWNVI